MCERKGSLRLGCEAFDLLRCPFFFQAEDGIRDIGVTGVQTCALPILPCVGLSAQSLTQSLSMINFSTDLTLRCMILFSCCNENLSGNTLMGSITSGVYF